MLQAAATRGSSRIPPRGGGLQILAPAPSNQDSGPRITAQDGIPSDDKRGVPWGCRAGHPRQEAQQRRRSGGGTASGMSQKRRGGWCGARQREKVESGGNRSGGGNRSSQLWASHFTPKTGKAPEDDHDNDTSRQHTMRRAPCKRFTRGPICPHSSPTKDRCASEPQNIDKETGSERLSSLPRVTQLESGRAGV